MRLDRHAEQRDFFANWLNPYGPLLGKFFRISLECFSVRLPQAKQIDETIAPIWAA